jgi:L-malate glycosyltransferase
LARKIKIIILGDVNSIHIRKWVLGLMNDFDITIFSLDPIPINEIENHPLKDVRLISNKEKTANQKGKIAYLRTYWKFRKAYKEIQPDIVHAHYATGYGLFGRLLRPKKLFISAWGSDVYMFPKSSFFHKFLFKWIIKGADQLFSTSHDMKRELEIYTSKSIEVVPFGIDLNAFNRTSSEIIENKKFIVGTIKSLEAVYGIDQLIESYALFQKEFPNSECHIYGVGSQEENLKLLAAKLGLEDTVIFKGYIDNTIVPSVLSSFDIFCVLSRRESFGVAVIEASACQVPIIATNVGGLPEVVKHEETGYLIEADVHEASRIMKELANDAELRKRLGKNGREFVETHYDWTKNLESMKYFYQR